MSTVKKDVIDKLERMMNPTDGGRSGPERSGCNGQCHHAESRQHCLTNPFTKQNLQAASLTSLRLLLVGSLILGSLSCFTPGSLAALLTPNPPMPGFTPTTAQPSFLPATPGTVVYQNPGVPQEPVVADANLGRTVVGAKLPGMSLKTSQLTGHVDTNSLTSVLYWTMDFANSGGQPQEARARIKLPEGAAVSRVTLWIDGVAQEAAFNSSSRTQAAYQWIVNTGRDPVLVTENKAGEVFVQAYPVPQHGEMKIRLGITTPLAATTRNEFKLVPPTILESNFADNNPENKLKLESNSEIDSNGDGQRITQDRSGTFTLFGQSAGNAPFSIHRKSAFTTFSSRATHSAEDSFITVRLNQVGNKLAPTFEKTQTRPDMVAYDFPTASRMSTLWAAAEARKCAALGEWNTAGLLGAAYRVVTPASGAVVLESQSDYDYTGLKRDFYNVVSARTRANRAHARRALSADKAFAPNIVRDDRGIIDVHTVDWQAPTLRGEGAGGGTGAQTGAAFYAPAPPTVNDRLNAMRAPVLQGATSGTIGPQGSDATVITGVNTAGSVRVNNLAYMEAILNIIVNVFQISTLAFGVTVLIKSGAKSLAQREAARRLMYGSAIVVMGIFCPTVVNFLVSTARDCNLFS